MSALPGIVWGFTGTQRGMTSAQRRTVIRLLSHPLTPAVELHHGDCIGADDEVDQIAEELCIDTAIHPPIIEAKRAWCANRWMAGLGKSMRRRTVTERPPRPYISRNHDIVDVVTPRGALIATPAEFSMQLRSGTWATLRYADRMHCTLRIVWPDGEVSRFL